MGKDTVIEVILRLRDQMGGQARKALDGLTQAARGAAQGAGATAQAVGSLDRAAQSMTGSAGASARAMRDMGRAGGGLRSDRVREMAQHVARTRQEAKGAARELDGAARSGERLAGALSRVGGAGRAALGALRGAGQAGAGLAAGGMVASRAMAKPMDFDQRLALMANTAYGNRDVAGRIAGKKELEAAIKRATDAGGGTREGAADALDAMLASGAIKEDKAKALLPTIQKFSTASGAQSTEIAEILIRGIQNKFFTADEAPLALDKALAAGQAGGFELKDMAKWLPKMMALGSGMKGMAGFEQILAYAQAAATTAGSKDEAGNNLVNLLQKLNSQDTQKDFKKLGIDLTGTLTRAREKGVMPLEAFGDLIEQRVMGKDKRYQDLKKRLGSAQGDEKKQILSDMTDLAGASAIGKVVQDRQALLALIAAINQKDYVKDVLGQMRGAQGAGDKSFAVVQDSVAAHVQGAKNELDAAMSRTLDAISGPLKSVLDAATGLAREFPVMTTVVAGATTAITAMSAAAAAFGAMQIMTGGGGAGAAATAVAAGARGAGLLTRAAKAAPWMLAGTAAWDIYQTETNPALTRAQKNINNTETYGATGGALAGMAGGAALGSAVPVLGTALGAVIGGLLGWWAGGKAGKETGNMLYGPSSETMEAAKKLVVEDRGTIKVETTLNVDGRELAKVVNEHNSYEAARD